jgi:hypothetical protein
MKRWFCQTAFSPVVFGLLFSPCWAQNAPPPASHTIPAPISVPDVARAGHVSPRDNLARLFHEFADRCWVRPASKTTVALTVHFNIYGRVLGTPKPAGPINTPGAREAVAAATKAVQACAPYKMPESRFHEWEHLTVTFDPTGK